MTRRLPIMLVCALACTLALAACASSDADAPVTVTVQPGPLLIAVQAEGQLKAVSSTPLMVPGPMWTQRQLAWVVPDGSRVKKGGVVARFSAEQSKQDLSEAMIDMARNTLAREDKQADLTKTRGQLNVNLAEVASQLAIADRYANATDLAVARNKILDAVQDKHFLTTKQGILEWRQHQSGVRGRAELGVVGAKRATLALKVKQARNDLDALELRAPHDGIVMLKADWSGQKPHVGASFFAGRPFADLPDLNHLQVVLQVPQIQAQGIQPGLAVELHPLGAPNQGVTSKVSWVAAAASPISRQSPVKYLAVKVPLPAKAVTEYGWMPGMRFSARIILIDAKSTLSVPNLALDTHGDGVRVHIDEGGKTVARKVTLGVSGAARSQIVSGLKSGDRVILETPAKEKAS